MKKKITTIFLCAALFAIVAIGASLAYFTDTDSAKNVFTVGNIDIELNETAKVTDANGEDVANAVNKNDNGGYSYSNLMPTYKLTKEPVIKNTGKNEAYVRVAVVMNNVTPINNAIDDAYEAKNYTNEQIQAVYDKVFDGWGISYTKRNVNGHNDRRMWMKERREDNKVLFNGQIDMYCNLGNYGMYDVKNTFMSDKERERLTLDAEGFDYECTGYYNNATKPEERIYVFYLKLDANESYTLFNGLNVPADFTEVQMEMFNNLEIGIYADAIQTAGFDNAEAAFNALEAEHPLGYWNE